MPQDDGSAQKSAATPDRRVGDRRAAERLPVRDRRASGDYAHTLTGRFHIHRRFRSQFLEHERSIIVYLPPDYEARRGKGLRYPVLYLHDGQNIFDRATSIGEEWEVDETAQSLIEAGVIEPLIIVGIYNTGAHRIDEYTPVKDDHVDAGGHADSYGRMLVQELKPFIDGRYRTLPGVANTGLGGSSLGGLVTLYLGLRYPTVFSKLAVVSPSVWWGGRLIVREVEALAGKLPLRIWLDAGTLEGDQVCKDARLLRDALVDKGWVLGEDLTFTEVDGGEHNERSWGARVDPILRYLYPRPGTRDGRGGTPADTG
jgi:predicted alpha/beta superfamily hydrolase